MFLRLARRAHTDRPSPSSHLLVGHKARACAAILLLGALGLGGCAQQPQQVAAAAAGHSKEYFPSSVYGAASRRVIADGQPVPRGGGQYLVGKPYTIAGQTYFPSERRVTQVGLASWYGDAFHGRLTANGEIYDRDSFTAAHPTMPLPSYARVTNLRNNTSMIVRVNDRGPYHSNRVMDVSRRVADALDIRRMGTAKVKVEWVARASLAGSDDAKLAATLRTDGPALANGIEEGIQLATAPARAVVASLGAFVPAPPRPVRYVEHERPDALETYRAPRVVAPRASRREEARPDDEDEARDLRRDEPLHAPRARQEESDDDTSETGSLRRRGERGHAADAGRRETARHDARTDRRDGGRRAEPHDDARRSMRQEDGRRGSQGSRVGETGHGERVVQRAESLVSPPRRPLAAGSHVMPPARPIHLAALAAALPPHRHGASPHGRSHDD